MSNVPGSGFLGTRSSKPLSRSALSGSESSAVENVTSELARVGMQISLQTPKLAARRSVMGRPALAGVTATGNTTSSL